MSGLSAQYLELYENPLGEMVRTPVIRVGAGHPHVVLVALQHGDEIIGLDAALRVLRQRPTRGRLTLVSVASPLAYTDGVRRSAYHVDPLSFQPGNLNATHPGDEAGNIAARTAAALNGLISREEPTLVLDLHACGRDTPPHSIVDQCAAETFDRMIGICTDAQIPWFVEDPPGTPTGDAVSHALSATWSRRGIPALTLELGPSGPFTNAQGEAAAQALANILVVAGAVEGAVTNVEPSLLEQLRGGWWRRHEVRHAGIEGGYLRILTDPRTPIRRGEPLAEVVSPTGASAPIESDVDGVFLTWLREWRVFSGSVLGFAVVPTR